MDCWVGSDAGVGDQNVDGSERRLGGCFCCGPDPPVTRIERLPPISPPIWLCAVRKHGLQCGRVGISQGYGDAVAGEGMGGAETNPARPVRDEGLPGR